MPCMTQTSPNPLRAPHVPPIPIRRPPRHHHSALRPISHPRSHPAPPSRAEPNQGQPYVDVDTQDPGSPSSPPPPDPGHTPLTPATIRDPDLLRATLQGRPPTTPLGWYRLQDDWTKLTVKALRDLTTPGSGLHEAIVDLVLWRARKHTQGQHVWIPPIEWGHQRHASRDRTPTTGASGVGPPSGPDRPEQWEQAPALTRETALRAAGLGTPDDDLPPPPTDSDHPPPEVWVTVLERGHYYVIAATATSPGPQWLVKGTDTMLAPGTAPPGAVGDPTTQRRVLRGVLQPGDKPPTRALAQITSGKVGYHLGLAMLCLTHWIQCRWPPTGTVPWVWAIPTAHTQVEAGPDTRPNPPPDRSNPSAAGTTPSTGFSTAWVLAQS